MLNSTIKKQTLLWSSALCFGLTALSGCSWVSTDADAQWVALVKPQAVGACREIGKTTSKTLSKLAWVNRSEQKLQSELITLAKNQAAVMQGNTLVADGVMQDGEQTFRVYVCD